MIAKMGNKEGGVATHATVLTCSASLGKRRRRWPEGNTPASLTLWLKKFAHVLEGEAGTALEWFPVIILLLVVHVQHILYFFL